MAESPSDIVGHKTFDTGELDPATGFPILRHEPLTRAEADKIIAAADEAKKRREETMPTERDAIEAMWQAHQRLHELGWRSPIYCPKDGTSFQVIEPGSTGIFRCHYSGEWPTGGWMIEEDGGCPSHPVLFKLYPEDQAKEDARWATAREKFRALKSSSPAQE